MNQHIPRPEFPRPDFQRQQWINLNGEWQFAFDDRGIGEQEAWYQPGHELAARILVPFCYQSEASGICDAAHHEVCWYKRRFVLEESFSGKTLLLKFGAVDYAARIYINGLSVGEHRGGYVPFSFNVTGYARTGENELTVRVVDSPSCSQPRGKQYWKPEPDRCWYTPCTGIWQTVWLEAVGDVYLEQIRITPDIDRRCVLIEPFLNRIAAQTELELRVGYKGATVKQMRVGLDNPYGRITVDLREEDYIDELHYWSPDTPNLYDLSLHLQVGGVPTDEVDSYFGMRKIGVRDGRIMLNNKPLYQKLVLDQGYWPDTLLTPPSEQALIDDIEMTKRFGYNGARKHQKIEDPLYYYWADRIGLLVWGEMPSGYLFNAEEQQNLVREWTEFLARDYNHPCIITWVPLNESWGVRNILSDRSQQDFADALYYLTKSYDSMRLVSTNDGWENVTSDIVSLHDYMPDAESFLKKHHNADSLARITTMNRRVLAEGYAYQGQPVLVTEYGGIAFSGDCGDNGNWGYFGAEADEEAFLSRFGGITDAIRSVPFIDGYCYTQLTDVFQEVNGLMTFDRQPKIDPEKIRAFN